MATAEVLGGRCGKQSESLLTKAESRAQKNTLVTLMTVTRHVRVTSAGRPDTLFWPNSDVVAAVKYQVKYSLQDENFDLVALL